jgi:NAD(P)-dependent dehydrogenase (short-subunit alcohol dehydrogenase family)
LIIDEWCDTTIAKCFFFFFDSSAAETTRIALEHAGDIDLLVNNAGIFIGQSFLETTTEAWDKVRSSSVREDSTVDRKK